MCFLMMLLLKHNFIYAFICLINDIIGKQQFIFHFPLLNAAVFWCATLAWGRMAAAVPTTRSPWPSSSSTTPLCSTWKRSPSSWPLSASCEKKVLSAKVSCQEKSEILCTSFGLIWLMMLWLESSLLFFVFFFSYFLSMLFYHAPSLDVREACEVKTRTLFSCSCFMVKFRLINFKKKKWRSKAETSWLQLPQKPQRNSFHNIHITSL